VPSALLHNLKHNRVLHEQTVFLTVETLRVPYATAEERASVEVLGGPFLRLTLRFGFMETPNVSRAMAHARRAGLKFDVMTSHLLPGPPPCGGDGPRAGTGAGPVLCGAGGTNEHLRNLPAPSPEQGLNRYLQEIRKFPLLEPEEEYMLAKAWADRQDAQAAHRLVTSHLRLAAKIAMGYRGYGLPQAEVISEANVGLMQAVKRFDPEKGFRLATYAMWWIRASIQEYILRSWSLVKLGTTSAQKKLFFNLRKAKAKVGALEEGDLRPENVAQIAKDLS
jgi:RNA polymerase sigma factor (sigma-70 family)